MLEGLRAVVAQPLLIAMERMGHRSFCLWGRLLQAIGPPGSRLRMGFAVLFALYLALALIVVAPISMLVRWMLQPLFARRMAADKAYFEEPSGSGTHRMTSATLATKGLRTW